MQQALRNNRLLILFVLLLLVYVAAELSTPIDAGTLSRYNLSEAKARGLTIGLIVPVVLIWSLAFYGFSKVRGYAQRLGTHKDGNGFLLISQGLMWLAISMALRSALSSGFDYVTIDYPQLEAAANIITNYLNVGLAVLSYYLISKGAFELTGMVKLKSSLTRQHYWVVLSALLSSLFTFLVMNRPIGEQRVYYLPNMVIILTIVVPYIYAWYRGFVGAYHLAQYRRRVKGMLYKKALDLVTGGVLITILGSILLQFLLAISANLTSLNLTPLLLFIYVLVLIMGGSFFLIALGARNLQKIEEA